MDLRIVKTNNALTQALFNLMEEKPIEDITVNEICINADTRRATFYQHFKDKYDLFAFTIKKIRKEFLTKGLENERDIASFCSTIVERSFKLFAHYRKLVNNNANSPSFLILQNIFASEIIETVRTKISETNPTFSYPGSPDFLANVYSGALVQVLRWWFKGETKESEGEIIRELGEFLSRL